MDGGILGPETRALSVRRLDRADLDAVEDLNAAQGDVMRHGKPDSYDASFRASLETHYLGDNDRCALFGAYSGDRLEACVSVYLWTTFPYCSTGNLKVRLGTTNPFSRAVTPLSLKYPGRPAIHRIPRLLAGVHGSCRRSLAGRSGRSLARTDRARAASLPPGDRVACSPRDETGNPVRLVVDGAAAMGPRSGRRDRLVVAAGA